MNIPVAIFFSTMDLYHMVQKEILRLTNSFKVAIAQNENLVSTSPSEEKMQSTTVS